MTIAEAIVPDSPDMNALWTLRLGHPMPEIRETDSDAYVRLAAQIARKVGDR
ncbi:MAG: hypothetical protein M0R28_17885 [Pigmentiphaga sp.]|nr:hypothetical protein [Pigmentiphaga sp.]